MPLTHLPPLPTLVSCLVQSPVAQLAQWLGSVNPSLPTFANVLADNGFHDRASLAFLDKESCTEMKIPIAQRNMLMKAVEQMVRITLDLRVSTWHCV
jgi:hypothetical protein